MQCCNTVNQMHVIKARHSVSSSLARNKRLILSVLGDVNGYTGRWCNRLAWTDILPPTWMRRRKWVSGPLGSERPPRLSAIRDMDPNKLLITSQMQTIVKVPLSTSVAKPCFHFKFLSQILGFINKNEKKSLILRQV